MRTILSAMVGIAMTIGTVWLTGAMVATHGIRSVEISVSQVYAPGDPPAGADGRLDTWQRKGEPTVYRGSTAARIARAECCGDGHRAGGAARKDDEHFYRMESAGEPVRALPGPRL